MAIKDFLPDIWCEKRTYSPSRELERLHRSIDQMFEGFFNMPTARDFFSKSHMDEEYIPMCDCDETDTNYLISFDLPGVKKEDVKIDLKDNQLTVSGERKGETKSKKARERFYGSFYRSFTLPSKVEADDVEAKFENGVLQISIPKTKSPPGKQIAIGEGNFQESKKEKK